jgi:hypothetical protein
MFNMFRTGRSGYERIEDISHEQLLSDEYEMLRRPFPKKEIIWGIVMFALGILLVGLSALIHFEHWENRVPGAFLFSQQSAGVCE